MYYFSLCLDGACLAGQAVMHLLFASRLTGKRLKLWHVISYLLLFCTIDRVFAKLAPSGIVSIGAGVCALYGMSRFVLKNQRSLSWLTAILAFYISQLSFGIINSAEAVIFPRYLGTPLLYLLLIAVLAVFFVLCTCCYHVVQKLLSLTAESQTPYLELLLFPGLFFFAAELYILHTAYNFLPPSLSLEEAGKHGALLFLQVMGLAALLCTLYAYRQLCRGFQAQAALQSLTQAAQAQKIYIAEAQTRYEQTKAFRHDIKNHLSVLDGLLNRGALDESKAYLKKLETASNSLSFPYQTGNPVVDILLGEKLGLAKEITAEVALLLPKLCRIDDFDLCVIFANALDNAINACRFSQGARSIYITGKQQGDFYMLTFENTCSEAPLPPAGTGLSNIKSVAEKYRGAVLTEKTGGNFSLHVLLNIS
ncbi:MAG: GHKL domain-containing protein [Oscillospiraceae bacterium]|nr:GHKL domain-containing protein [Oscillospiraceae bacterium]